MPRSLRIVLPALVVLVWLTVAAIGGPFSGRIAEVSTNDPTAFLPASADATAVQERSRDFRDATGVPAVVVLERDGGLDDAVPANNRPS